jgi:hypothetical protein
VSSSIYVGHIVFLPLVADDFNQIVRSTVVGGVVVVVVGGVETVEHKTISGSAAGRNLIL